MSASADNGLGARVKSARSVRGWTQHELADLSGVSRSTIANLESGRMTSPAPEVVFRLSSALRWSMSELLGLDELGGPSWKDLSPGGRIAVARRILGQSQKEVGEAIGVTSMQVSNIERDETLGSLAVLSALCVHLGVSPDWVMRGTDY